MKKISKKYYNLNFCNNYKEKYNSVPRKTNKASSQDEVIRAICRYSQGKGKILEIGTWIGRSALAFSQNFDQVVTIDNPENSDIKYDYLGCEPGFLIKNNPNVKFISIDSFDLKYKSYKNYFDCCFIDGNHTEKYVYNDIKIAEFVCKKKSAIFVDDYFGKMFEVKKVFDKLENKIKYKIDDLNLVFFINNLTHHQ